MFSAQETIMPAQENVSQEFGARTIEKAMDELGRLNLSLEKQQQECEIRMTGHVGWQANPEMSSSQIQGMKTISIHLGGFKLMEIAK